MTFTLQDKNQREVDHIFYRIDRIKPVVNHLPTNFEEKKQKEHKQINLLKDIFVSPKSKGEKLNFSIGLTRIVQKNLKQEIDFLTDEFLRLKTELKVKYGPKKATSTKAATDNFLKSRQYSSKIKTNQFDTNLELNFHLYALNSFY